MEEVKRNKTNGRFMRIHEKVYLPCLKDKMKLVGATNATLADESGISHNTIQRAKNGESIRTVIALTIYEALNTRRFKNKCLHF